MTVNDLDALAGIMSEGDDHAWNGNVETPMHPEAFRLSDEEKVRKIEHHFREIMHTLGLDLNDDSLSGTPHRVAKMYVEEIFAGLKPENRPEVKLFSNKYKYREMLVERQISFYSNCEHHFVPIIGHAHIAYISNGYVIGLSKINRIVRYYAARPQVQERMTEQIAAELKRVLKTDDVAVIIDAAHLCVGMRGVKDDSSRTVTSHYSGAFRDEDRKAEFFRYVYGEKI